MHASDTKKQHFLGINRIIQFNALESACVSCPWCSREVLQAFLAVIASDKGLAEIEAFYEAFQHAIYKTVMLHIVSGNFHLEATVSIALDCLANLEQRCACLMFSYL